MKIILIANPHTKVEDDIIKALTDQFPDVEIEVRSSEERPKSSMDRVHIVSDMHGSFDIDQAIVSFAQPNVDMPDLYELRRGLLPENKFMPEAPKSLAQRNKIDPGWWNRTNYKGRKKW